MSEFETMSFSGNSINCYGLEVVKWQLKKYGHQFFDYNSISDRPILFSVYWPEQIFDFYKWRYSQKKERAIIVGGNTVVANPQPFIYSGCKPFIGDGELWDGSLDSKYIANDNFIVEKATSDRITPIRYEDLQSNRRAFCEMSRGCINKCLFCQYGWMKKYVESDICDIKNVIIGSKTKSVRLFAADRFQHSRYLDIRNILDKNGKCDTGSDVSMRFVYKNPEYLKYTNKVRCGLEGMSERLRSYIGKAFTDDQVVQFCKNVASANIKSLDFYMIYGLPTETEEDVIAFRELLLKIDKVMPSGYTICIHWNAFTPSAQTPFQWAASSYGYNREFLNKYIFGIRENKRIKIMHKPKFTGDSTIALRMLAIRVCKDSCKLIYNIAIKGGKLKKDHNFIIREYEKVTGKNLVGEWNVDSLLPWDKYVKYDKEKMLKIYMAKNGISEPLPTVSEDA